MTETKCYARETRQGRLLQLEEENATLKSENIQLKKDNKDLRIRNDFLRRRNKEFTEKTVPSLEKVNKVSAEKIQKLKKEMLQLKKSINEKIQKEKQLTKDKEELSEKLRGYEEELLLALQRDGEICAKNCIPCAVLGICKRKLGYCVCPSQLPIVISKKLAPEEIKNEDLRCENMLELLTKCKIVRVEAEAEYPYTAGELANVWQKLMKMSGTDCILGVKKKEAIGGGHCVEVDLESRTKDGKVTMYDRKNPDKKDFNMSEGDFLDYVKGTEGVRLYSMDLKMFQDTLQQFAPVIHVTDGERWFNLSMTV